jgi:ADP-ribosyl-[dinitrogen reductase] hydrolase
MSSRDSPNSISIHDRVTGGIVGLLVGDALGVPVEFRPREHLKAHPVTGIRGFGTHNQPPGTWSDDGSLALATLASLLDGYDPDDVMKRFSRWWSEGYMTPHGVVFDIGNTTSAAIQRFNMKARRDVWGGVSERENGNGSLMRILPLSLYVHRLSTDDIVARSCEISALTHAHIRSCLCCAYYSLLVREVLKGAPFAGAMVCASEQLMPHVPTEEREVLGRVLACSVIGEPESSIRSGGYVVHCLEASLWCVGHHDSYAEAVLAAVNLGGDTDTTAAVTGGLAGVQYGIEAIPREWRDAIARRDEVMALAEAFANVVCKLAQAGAGEK